MFDYSVCDLCVRDIAAFGTGVNPCDGCEDLIAEKELLAAIFGSLDDPAVPQQIITAPCPECCHSHHCEAFDEVGYEECGVPTVLSSILQMIGSLLRTKYVITWVFVWI